MSERKPALAERKQLLLARSELARLQIRQAGQEARATLAPIARFVPVARAGAAGMPFPPLALALTAAALPLLGARRLGRVLRLAGTGLALLRLARHFRH
jgi:hypothetical protein